MNWQIGRVLALDWRIIPGLTLDWQIDQDLHIGPGLDCLSRPLLRHFGRSRIVLVPLTKWGIKTGLALDWRIGKRLTN